MRYKLILLPSALAEMAEMGQKHGKNFKSQLLKTLTHLGENIQHPGLNVHAVVGWEGWKEAYINQGDRLIFKVVDDQIIIAWCGSHEALDKQAFAPALKAAEE